MRPVASGLLQFLPLPPPPTGLFPVPEAKGQEVTESPRLQIFHFFP